MNKTKQSKEQNMNRNIAKTGLIVLALLSVSVIGVMATETTWRHSGFEVWGYDINYTGYNITNVWLLDFKGNGTVPVSASGHARLYFDNASNKLKISENGGAYNTSMTNTSILNTSTITVGRNADGTMQFTSVVTLTQLLSNVSDLSVTATKDESVFSTDTGDTWRETYNYTLLYAITNLTVSAEIMRTPATTVYAGYKIGGGTIVEFGSSTSSTYVTVTSSNLGNFTSGQTISFHGKQSGVDNNPSWYQKNKTVYGSRGISNSNITNSRTFNTEYTNSNTKNIMLQVVAQTHTSVANDSAMLWCESDSILVSNLTTLPFYTGTNMSQASGKVGISQGLLNQKDNTQLTCMVAPGAKYAVNTSGTGTVTLTDWREIFI